MPTICAFAETGHSESYYDLCDPLLKPLQQRFDSVQSGVRGDAWIKIFEGGPKAAVDMLSSMQFEIHSVNDNPLLRVVIGHICEQYPVQAYDKLREY